MVTNEVERTKYQPEVSEPRWQSLWEARGQYLARRDDAKQKYYCLDFFPYPSGEGLHVGHCRNYVPTDVFARYQRMRGFNVLRPFGWDAFGEPTEQYAVTHGIHPQESTRRNTANFRRQLELIGTSYDWRREIWSSDPAYYRWTQWFFLMLYRRGLAYRDTNWQWWCPTCQTTLSSHEVVGGVCWRGHEGVTRREIPAWYFRITAYADRLLEGLDRIDWPDPIKKMQSNWIGRSEGVQVVFPLKDQDAVIETFTTRPDTLFGVTFIAMAPEHPLVEKIVTVERREAVETYQQQAYARSEIERMDEATPRTGVFTGAYARHPLSGEPVPIWVSDYVLPSYGTGAVMGVPAHDQRDYNFAYTFHLPVVTVIEPVEAQDQIPGSAYTGEGRLVNSAEFCGQNSQAGAENISDRLVHAHLGQRTIQYRMRDWLISRQRYWGTPIPIIHCPDCGEVPVPEDQLPVLLPDMEDFQPDGSGQSPLARVDAFVHTTCPQCDGPARRETDTMGGFACSSWYFLRFASPDYDDGPFDPEAVRYWLPVDLYIGGAEHAVLHLLYARFWTKVMFDEGLISFDEPFTKLINQGQLMGEDGARMSKSRGNVVTPDSVVEAFGADALRLYVMFIAPFDQDANWSLDGIHGTRRFLNRLWNLYQETYDIGMGADTNDPELERKLHQTTKAITERVESFRFNTAVSYFMEFVNLLVDRHQNERWRTKTYQDSLETLLVLLAPFVPYITESLWEQTGHSGSVHSAAWPSYDPVLAVTIAKEIAVQVDGKLREVLVVEDESNKEEIVSLAQSQEKVAAALTGTDIKKVVYIPGRVLNFVTH